MHEVLWLIDYEPNRLRFSEFVVNVARGLRYGVFVVSVVIVVVSCRFVVSCLGFGEYVVGVTSVKVVRVLLLVVVVVQFVSDSVSSS